MQKTWLLFSILLCFIGLLLGYVYRIPFGFVLDGIGVMVFIYAIRSDGESKIFASREQYLKGVYQDDYKCGNCLMFGKGGCPRKEKLLNAKPCEDYFGNV